MTAFRIRPPRLDEADVIGTLHNTAWSQTYGAHFPSSAWDEDARVRRVRMWQRILADTERELRVAVAEREGALIGFALSSPMAEEPGMRELGSLYLLQDAYGSGAGQALLDAVIGDEAAALWVLEGNPRAQRFYERNGFRLEGTRRPSGFDGANDEIHMRRGAQAAA